MRFLTRTIALAILLLSLMGVCGGISHNMAMDVSMPSVSCTAHCIGMPLDTSPAMFSATQNILLLGLTATLVVLISLAFDPKDARRTIRRTHFRPPDFVHLYRFYLE